MITEGLDILAGFFQRPIYSLRRFDKARFRPFGKRVVITACEPWKRVDTPLITTGLTSILEIGCHLYGEAFP